MLLLEPKQGPKCEMCPLYRTGIKIEDIQPTPGSYSGLTLIGDMPGRVEIGKRQSNLDGILRAMASLIGMNVDTLHITNCIKCGLKSGQKPSDAEGQMIADCCRPLVNENLKRIGTKVALCVGSISWNSMSGLKGIDRYRGTVLPGDSVEPWDLTCTLHPAGLRAEARAILADLLYADFEKAWKMALGEVTMWEPNIGDASDIDSLMSFLQAVNADKIPVACDVETDGIHAFDFDKDPCNLLVNGFAAVIDDEIHAYSIPYRKAYPDFYTKEEWAMIDKVVADILDDPKQPVVFHNKRFDVPVLERYYDFLHCVKEDTILLHHAVYPKLPHNLESVTSQFLAVEPWKSEYKNTEGSIFKEHKDLVDDWDDKTVEERQEVLTQIKDLERTSFEELLWYNAMDAAATIYLFHALTKEAIEDDVHSVYLKDRELDDETLNWQYSGIGIDLDERAKLEIVYDEKIDNGLEEMRKECLLPTNKDMAKKLNPLLKEKLETDEQARKLGRVATLMRKAEELAKETESTDLACCLPLVNKKRDNLDKLEGQLDEVSGDNKKKLKDKIARLARTIDDIDTAETYLVDEESSVVVLQTSKSLKSEIRAIRKEIKEIEKLPTVENFKPGSANHIREVLSLRGLSPLKVCDKAVDKDGNRLLAVSKDSLWDLRDDIFVSTLFVHRTDAKLQSTYIRNLEYKLGTDGRLHPTWRIPSTPSGRFGTQPGVQNWPFAMKKLMVPGSGNVIVGADYAALELRVAALTGDEQEWIKIFMEGGDLHSLMAHKYFSRDYPALDAEWHAVEGSEDDKNEAVPRRKELRGRGKTITFGDIYLAGAETLYYQVREKMPDVKTEAEHRALRKEVAHNQNVLRAATPNRIAYAAISQKFATKNSYLCTPSWEDQYGVMCGGRARKWPLGDPSPNETANHPIQGCHPSWTKILTSDGYIAIGDAPLHGHVWTGSSWESYDKLNMGVHELAQLELESGQKLGCDTRHEVLVETSEAYAFKKFKDLEVGDSICQTVAQPLEFGRPGESQDDFYWMGYALGNGCTGKTGGKHPNSLSVTFGDRKDRYERIDQASGFVDYIEGYFGVKTQKPQVKSGCLTVRAESRVIKSHWVKLGYCWEKTAHHKIVPTSVWGTNLACRKDFLIGLLDADGTVGCRRAGGPNLHMCQEFLLAEVKMLLRTCGVESSIHKTDDGWRLTLHGGQAYRHLGYGDRDVQRSNMLAPLFQARVFVAAIPCEDLTTDSHKTIWHRIKKGGTTGVYTLLDMYAAVGVKAPIMYASSKLRNKKSCGVDAPTYTLSVNHPLHRYDAEGVISKNCAADIMNNATMRFVQRLRDAGLYCNGAWIILQVHDALYLEVKEQYAEQVRVMLEESMYTEISLRSPVTNKVNFMKFTAEASIGDSVARVG